MKEKLSVMENIRYRLRGQIPPGCLRVPGHIGFVPYSRFVAENQLPLPDLPKIPIPPQK